MRGGLLLILIRNHSAYHESSAPSLPFVQVQARAEPAHCCSADDCLLRVPEAFGWSDPFRVLGHGPADLLVRQFSKEQKLAEHYFYGLCKRLGRSESMRFAEVGERSGAARGSRRRRRSWNLELLLAKRVCLRVWRRGGWNDVAHRCAKRAPPTPPKQQNSTTSTGNGRAVGASSSFPVS